MDEAEISHPVNYWIAMKFYTFMSMNLSNFGDPSTSPPSGHNLIFSIQKKSIAIMA